MKTTASIILIIAALATSAQAALVGFDAGYLIDGEEEFLAARVGFEVGASQRLSHQVELEVGYSETKESGLKGTFVPVTLNYRVVAPGPGNWSYYAGGGAGFARTRVSGLVSLSDESFAVQGFVGAGYRLTDAATLNLGLRYIWIDDIQFAGESVEVGDDVAISVGLSFRF